MYTTTVNVHYELWINPNDLLFYPEFSFLLINKYLLSRYLPPLLL